MRSTLRSLLLVAALVGGLVAAAPAPSAGPRDDADHTEHYFPAGDGVTMLHADVLRPAGLADDVATPVILTVTPYANHSGSTSFDYDPDAEAPHPRFFDFLDLSGALDQGYTYVMVDLPGFGGSGGCNDWGGAREQDAVRAAVEWAASRSWSTGKVALLGKSYDGWTGLMGIAQQPEGLAAVVALEPVYAGYRYIFNNGVRRSSTVATIASFQANDAKPGTTSDSPEYHVTGAPQAWCYGVNVAGSSGDTDPSGPYWAERDLLRSTEGRTTPLFLTQGFLETNTLPDGAFRYFNGLAGDDNRAWYGQFNHCRAWETERACSRGATPDDRLAVGRDGFMDELMRFLDLHLKGIEPSVDDPTIEIQDIRGRWRAEEAWPPADMRLYETTLNTGTYVDDGTGSGLRPSENQGIWTISEPLPHEVWFAGEPSLSVTVEAVPEANLAANVYDVDPDGNLRMISRGVSLLRGAGTRTLTLPMFGQDWPIAAGHRIAVLVSNANDGYTHVGTRSTVTIASARIRLPFLTDDRTEFLPSLGTPRLESFLEAPTTQLSQDLIDASERPFDLPAPLR